jgi:hypothetical protein
MVHPGRRREEAARVFRAENAEGDPDATTVETIDVPTDRAGLLAFQRVRRPRAERVSALAFVAVYVSALAGALWWGLVIAVVWPADRLVAWLLARRSRAGAQ